MTDTSATETSRAVFYAWGEIDERLFAPTFITVEVNTHVEIFPPLARGLALPASLLHVVFRAKL